MDRSELTGIILAGGKSSRMGREKGLVEFHGKPLIQYGIDLLARYTDRILISSANPDYLSYGLELVTDTVTGQGPAAGLASTLQQSVTPWNLVIACDLPFLEPELMETLLANTEGFQAVVPIHDDVKEPLAALYHSDLAEHFADSIEAGNLALHKILVTRKVHYLDVQFLLGKYPKLFINLNSMSELEI